MNRLTRIPTGLVIAIVAMMTLWQLVTCTGAQQVSGRGLRRASAIDKTPANPEPIHRLREGTVLTNELGVFKVNGDRIVFYPAQRDDTLQVLENLALERVWKMLDESRGRQWSINGMITEYRGGNYLLIERAVLKAQRATDPATP